MERCRAVDRGRPTEEAARRADRGASAGSGALTDPERGKVKLADYAAIWITQRPNLRPRTVDLYRWLLKKHIVPYLGAVPLGKMSTPSELAKRAGVPASTVRFYEQAGRQVSFPSSYGSGSEYQRHSLSRGRSDRSARPVAHSSAAHGRASAGAPGKSRLSTRAHKSAGGSHGTPSP